jgi:small-conductance mechanosensitive channel
MPNLFELLQAYLTQHPDYPLKLINSGVVVVVLMVLRWLFMELVIHLSRDDRVHYEWRKTSTYIMMMVMLMSIGAIWVDDLGSVATFLGFLSAGIAIALRDVLASMMGWSFIVSRKPFELGDRIQIQEHTGDVIDVRLLQFSLMEVGNWVHADQSTGRVIHLPNSLVFTNSVANYNKGLNYIWNELVVNVTYESNWREAKDILSVIAQKHSAVVSEDEQNSVRRATRRFLIKYPPLTPIVYTRVGQHSIQFAIRYLCSPRRRRSTENDIWEDVLVAFAQHDDIQLAYHTQRLYMTALEDGLATDLDVVRPLRTNLYHSKANNNQ